MTNEVLLYTGSALSIVWGIAHLAPTRAVVKDFGDISADNRRIITMEWLAEGFTLIFIGLLVLLLVGGEGIEPEQVAALLGLSAENLRQRLSRGRAMLRERLADAGAPGAAVGRKAS